MEVMTKPSLDVNSPKRFPEYYSSAPTTPSHHLSHFYRHFHDFQENPTTPKIKTSVTIIDDDDTDFAFDVTENWETASALAEQLFHDGVIKTLKPPPPPPKVNPKQGSSPRHKTKTENHPFAASAQVASRSAAPPQRGRERTVNSAKSSSWRRAARSLSPLRDGQQLWEEEEEETEENACSNGCASAVIGNKKWRLKDLFLFRSASEGRAADKDPLRKYTAASGSRRRVPISAHELHYTANRAVSHDLKKKTFLPYKQGILGRLAFNPAVHALSNGFGFSRN